MRDRRANDSANTKRRGQHRQRLCPLLPLGPGGDIGLNRRRRGGAKAAIQAAEQGE